MTKNIIIKIEKIQSANDINFVKETVDNIIDCLMDYPNVVTSIALHKDRNKFNVKFNLQVCKTGDLVFCLIYEWCKLIIHTEEQVNVFISELEEGDEDGTIIHLLKYKKVPA